MVSFLTLQESKKEAAYVVLRVDKVPPVLTAECIFQRLTSRVIPGSIASIKVRVLRPRNVYLGMVVVLHTVRISRIAGVNLIRRESVLNVAPGQVMVAAVR